MTRDDDAPDQPAHAATVASTDPGPTPADAPPHADGTVLGRYRLGAELGAGGMATVYRARDLELRRDVAVKVLFPHLARKPELVRRFQREARAAAGLEHPNILRVYDVGDDDAPFIVMELVRGHSLREVAEAEGALPAELVAAIGALLCDALAVAHAAGIVHRDVKPANLMLADDGRLLLADFGVARIEDDDSLVTRTGALLGTPSFMAPEQARGHAADARCDLYSVGVTLYQLATGALPFAGPTMKVLADAAKGAVPAGRRSSAVGTPLSRVIERLMDPDPARRPTDATVAARELRQLVDDVGLGEPAAELAAFARDRAGYRATRTPQVVRALVGLAEAAGARGATAVALGHCDRILALAPDHPGATAVVTRLTRAGSRRRRLLWVGAPVIALAGGALAWRALAPGPHRGSAAPADAGGAVVAPTPDAAPDAASAAALALVDAGSIDASVLDAGPVDARRRGDPSPTEVAPLRPPVDAAPARDAAVEAPVDAATRAVDAAPALAQLTLVVDTWCDLTIDGQPRGRASRRPIDLAPGRHVLSCRQGLGQQGWSETLVLAPGEARTVTASVLAPVTVRNGLTAPVRLGGTDLAPGATTAVRPGRLRLERVVDGVAANTWLDIPRVPACTLRASPQLDCYP
ncbi:MAG: serine/threonine-protein kinase [Kofleriaceae bacterium]